MCQRMGARLVWAMSNFIVFACMAGTAIISLVSVNEYITEGIQHAIGENRAIKIASLVVFALLGFPLSVSNKFSSNFLLFLPSDFCLCLHALTFFSFLLFSFLFSLCFADYL